MILKGGLAGQGVLDRRTAILVVGLGRTVLPVVGVVLQVLAPVDLFQGVQLAHFHGRVMRFGRRRFWRQLHFAAHCAHRTVLWCLPRTVAVGRRLVGLGDAFQADFAAGFSHF